ncbi:MAG TPA: signal peptidase I [Rubrivivax sp.]|nr:signal peptidase I [Rubrivivax sp.]
MLPPGWRLLRPNKALAGLALIALVPVVVGAVYSMIPRAGRAAAGATSLVVWLLALGGGLIFLTTLLTYRVVRKRQQMRLNASLGDQPPERFVLYLRSFRRTGATVVPNHLPTLAERRLLGNFLDVELALTLAVGEHLPVLAVGHTASGVGAAKLFTDDDSWKALVERLARTATAIFVVPDDREGTLWELDRLLSDPILRTKTVILMPPEQHGWWCLLHRLPTVAESWTRARDRLPQLRLPDYQAEGAFLLPNGTEVGYTRLPYQHFSSEHVRKLVEAAATGTEPTVPSEPVRAPDEDWRASIDPVWPVVAVGVLIALWVLGDPTISGRFDAVLVALLFGAATSLLLVSVAFTRTREPSDNSRELFQPSTWFGLRTSPRVVRATVNLFATVAVVATLRFFVLEPFRVPSSNMLPSLLVGDFILVSKSAYGLRLPVTNKRLLGSDIPERGDVVAFHYPVDPTVDFVKRVIGLPGDEVTYINKNLTINGQPVPTKALSDLYDEDSLRYVKQFGEAIGKAEYRVLADPDRPARYGSEVRSFPMNERCQYTIEGVTCKVPAGHYFVMGDNRDNSYDSRYWGFVPDDHIVGQVLWVAMNWGAMHRTGKRP